MQLSEIEEHLQRVADNFRVRNVAAIETALKHLKASAVRQSDQAEAKYLWCLERALAIQQSYVSAFDKLKAGDYYAAWCDLETAEIACLHLNPHLPIDENEYALKFIRDHVSRYQVLYPYRVFLSPEMVYLEKECSVCGCRVSIRNPCGHKVGEVYNGEMCARMITKLDLIGMSMVTNPSQRYSVVFLNDSESGERTDQYDYSLVAYVVEGLRSPFHGWDFAWTQRYRSHAEYSEISGEDQCPCNSGKRYSDCCLTAPGVRRPHCEITFDVSPPEHLPEFRSGG